MKYIDEIINVTDRDSFQLARRLGREEGIFCGGSTGTICWAALQVARDLPKDDVVVFIVCDTGERYLTKFHSDEWLKEKRLLGVEKMTIGLLNQVEAGRLDTAPGVGRPDHRVARGAADDEHLRAVAAAGA